MFCTNENGDPVPLPISYIKKPLDGLKTIDNFSNLYWNIVIVGGRNSFIRNTNILRGSVQMKKRQSNKLGYTVSVVSKFLIMIQ